MTEMDRKVGEAWEKRKTEGKIYGHSRSEVTNKVLEEFERTLSPEQFDIMLLKSDGLVGSFGAFKAYELHTRILLRLLAAAGK
jgi:hypothetical protein